MSLSQLAGASYLNPIRLARAQNGAGAEGQLPSDLAAYNRWIAEYASGAVQQEQIPVAPPTPIFGYTTPGHDHSGGLMGKPLKHTVWHSMYGYIAQSGGVYEYAPSVIVQAADTSATRTLADSQVRGVWIPGGRIYERLMFEVRLHCITTASTYNVTIRPIEGGPSYTATGSLTAGANNDITIADVAFRPGRLQNFYYSITITYGAGTSKVYLVSAALHQTSDTP